MASTVLPNGIIIPEKYSRDWYADLYHNWQELDNLLGGGTPKDGTLTIQKNGTDIGTFSANQSTNETINITVPTVNDATLTIQKNGTTVDTFTANSSTDKTVDITVPTKTSDLTNDSGFITEDNTKIPLSGSNAISGDLIPSTNGTVNLGTSTNKWKSINGINPGALSYPNKSSYINIDTTNWDLTCSNQGVMAEYVAEKSGWLLLQIGHGSADIVDLWVVTNSIRINSKSTFNTLYNRNFNMISLPLVESETLRIFGNASQYVAGRIIDYARIYTGLGQA